MKIEKTNSTLVPIQNQGIVKVEKSIRIANKLIEGRIEKLFNEAFLLLNIKQNLNPNINYYSWFVTGSSYTFIRDYGFDARNDQDCAKAIQNLSEILKINPNHEISYLIRGFCYFDISKYSEAISDFEMAIKINPNNPYGYRWRGFSNVMMRNYREAIPDYTKAFDVDNTYTIAIRNRATTKVNIGDYAGALEDFNYYIEIEPDDVYGFIYGIGAYEKLLDFEGAIQFCNNYEKLNLSYNAQICWQRASLKETIDDINGALIDYKKAFNQYPKYKEWFDARIVKTKKIKNLKELELLISEIK